MEKKIEYRVEISSGRFLPGQMKTETFTFKQEDPFKARRQAIELAIIEMNKAKMEEKVDDPELFRELPEIVHNIDAYSTDIFFCSSDEEWLIYGSEVHEVLTGLYAEAKYYLKHNLIEKAAMVDILENRESLEKDPNNPAYVIANPEMGEIPDFDFYAISVLPNDLELILMNHSKNSDDSDNIEDYFSEED